MMERKPIFQVRSHGSSCWEDISGESLEICRSMPDVYEIRTIYAWRRTPVMVSEPHAEPSHWADPDGNTITAELKAYNLALGGAPASASNRYTEPLYRRPAVQAQGERQAFEQAFVVQEGVYFSDDHGEYRSMNGRSIEQRDASDLNLRLSGWNARASLSNQPQCSLIPQSLRSAMSAIEDEVACMGGNAQSVFTKMRTAVQAHFHRTEPEAPEGASWYAASDIDQLVRELDVLLNGEGAAPQAKLCDLVAQVRRNPSAVRKNSDRYLWLRKKQTFIWLIQDWFPSDAEVTDVDAVIDAAMIEGKTP
ncbi:MAG: hypothetical protein K0S85_35 [Pseudomonas orientalis]|nr:hypothetical protein [Pseudomonas orientalis]